MRFQKGFGPIVIILKRKKVMHLTHHQSLSKSQKICRIRVSSFYYIVMYLLKLNRKLFGLVSNLFFKRSRYTSSYLPIQELFLWACLVFWRFSGEKYSPNCAGTRLQERCWVGSRHKQGQAGG